MPVPRAPGPQAAARGVRGPDPSADAAGVQGRERERGGRQLVLRMRTAFPPCGRRKTKRWARTSPGGASFLRRLQRSARGAGGRGPANTSRPRGLRWSSPARPAGGGSWPFPRRAPTTRRRGNSRAWCADGRGGAVRRAARRRRPLRRAGRLASRAAPGDDPSAPALRPTAPAKMAASRSGSSTIALRPRTCPRPRIPRCERTTATCWPPTPKAGLMRAIGCAGGADPGPRTRDGWRVIVQGPDVRQSGRRWTSCEAACSAMVSWPG